jgi:hypothetical protein
MEAQFKETDKQIQSLSKRFGDLGNSFGEVVEYMVAPGIADRFNERGYHFHGVYPGGLEVQDEQGRTLTEVDILLENDDFIIAVEVKSKPVFKDIAHHIKRLQILQRYFSKNPGFHKKIAGALAGATFSNDLKQAAIEAGLYVIVPSGSSIKLDIPQNFEPLYF